MKNARRLINMTPHFQRILIGLYALLSLNATAVLAQVSPKEPDQTQSPDQNQSNVTTPQFFDLFSDHGVLQRRQTLTIWGKATPNSALKIGFKDQILDTTADQNGDWSVKLPPQEAGGPYELSLTDQEGNTQIKKDIMIGDVYLCSGQSNMEFLTQFSTNAMNELNLKDNPSLRYALIKRTTSPRPEENLPQGTQWKIISKDTIADTSASCYYMAKALQPKIGVTIGMISASWGGTIIESWMSRAALEQQQGYEEGLKIVDAYAKSPIEAEALITKATKTWWKKHLGRNTLKGASPKTDDTTWDSLSSSRNWEDSHLSAYERLNGVVWYRQTLTLSAQEAQNINSLSLGLIDDSDETFVNGTLIGKTQGWDVARHYDIKPDIFKAGINVIAVRITDTGGGGGPYGDPVSRHLGLKDGQTIILDDQWRTQIILDSAAMATLPVKSWQPMQSLTTLYNGMINPYRRYGLTGVVWYQGESNAGRSMTYQALMQGMIKDWRTQFNNPSLAFLIVQLANFGATSTTPYNSPWGGLREAQRQAALNTPMTGLAVAIDLGDRFDIHPSQKSILGQRLARTAQRLIYGQDAPQSPTPLNVIREADDLLIRFKDAESGLISYSSNQAIGFEACDAQKSCQYVTALVEGSNVRLKSANRPETAFVRYAYADAPFINLYSKEDQPVTPFEMPID